MRLIGKALTLTRVQQFAHKLNQLNIEHSIEPHSQKDGRWQVWIVDEEALSRAQREWVQFERDSGHVDFSVSPSAGLLPELAQDGDIGSPLHFEKTWIAGPRARRKSPLTCLIALVSCLVWLASCMEINSDFQRLLHRFASKSALIATAEIEPLSRISFAHPILAQLIDKKSFWSFFWGNFTHKNAAELVFQLFWFVFFSAQIEQKVGTARAFILILVSAIVCNAVQCIVSGPGAIGLASLNCALVAFSYTRYRRFPWEGYRVPLWGLSYFVLFLAFSIGCSAILWCANAAMQSPLSDMGLKTPLYLGGLLVGRWLARVPFAKIRT